MSSPSWELYSTTRAMRWKKKNFCKQLTSPQQAPPLLIKLSSTNSRSASVFGGGKKKTDWLCSSTTFWNEGSLLSQRWRGNYTNKLLWDIHNGVMSEMLWLAHAAVFVCVCLRIAIGSSGQTWVDNNLSSCLSNDQPGSLSSEWGSVVSQWGLDEGQILVKVEARG